MGPGVIEVENGPAGQAPAQRECQRVIGGCTGVHPGRHRTALQREEGVSAGGGDLIASNRVGRVRPRAGRVAVESVEAVKIASAVVRIDTAEVVRRSASGKIEIGETWPHVFDERQSGHETWVVLDSVCG